MAGELIVKNGLRVSGSTIVSGSITATSFTGSFSGSITSASYALTATTAVTASFFSGSISNAVSSSFAATASSVNALSQSVLISGSLRALTVEPTNISTNYFPKKSSTFLTSSVLNSSDDLDLNWGPPSITPTTPNSRGIIIYGLNYSQIMLRVSGSTGNDGYMMQARPGGNFAFTNIANNTQIFTLGSDVTVTALTILGSNGNVGMGQNGGSVGINWPNIYTIPSKFYVSGSVRFDGATTINGTGTTSATTAFTVKNANASSSLVVRDDGWVGVGTASPTNTFEVSGSATISGSIVQRGPGIYLYDISGFGGGRIYGGYGYANGEIFIRPLNGNPDNFIFSPTNGMSIGGFTIGGTVGSPPAYGLAVSGSVGIGTRVPTTQLDVSGSGRFTSNLTVTGSVVATSLTGSLLGTASYAANSELIDGLHSNAFVTNNVTGSMLAPYLLVANTSSFATTTQLNSYLLVSNTGSFVVNSQTGSFVTNSQTGSFVVNSQTGSFVLNSFTSSMLAPYLLVANTSSFATTTQLNSYLLLSNTSSMLAPYLLVTNTGSMVAPYLLISNTSSMLTPYLPTGLTSSFAKTNTSNTFVGTQVITGSLSVTGSGVSGSFSGSFLGDGSGLSGVAASFPTTPGVVSATTQYFVNNVGSSQYITHTQVANALAGGGLTSNGTSLTVNSSSFSGSFLLISSTGSMLAPYLLVANTSSLATTSQLASYLLISNTGSMLAPYLLVANTGSMLSPYTPNSQTGSFVRNNQTSSFVQNSQTSSMLAPYLLVSNTSSFATTTQLNSYLLISNTASMVAPYMLVSNTGSMLSSYTPNSQTGSFIRNNQTSSFYTGSFTGSFIGTSSFAATASRVNTLNQNVLITGSLTVGATSLGSTENTLVLGPPPGGGTGEGGQILLAAAGGTYTSASMLDTYQDSFRVLRGTNASSDAFKLKVDLNTGQVQIPNYNGPTAFTGTPVNSLATDTSGNILTVQGYTGIVTINTIPPVNFDIQNGIVMNVF